MIPLCFGGWDYWNVAYGRECSFAIPKPVYLDLCELNWSLEVLTLRMQLRIVGFFSCNEILSCYPLSRKFTQF